MSGFMHTGSADTLGFLILSPSGGTRAVRRSPVGSTILDNPDRSMRPPSPNNDPLQQPWCVSVPRILSELATDVEQGLPDHEIAPRRRRFGSNQLRRARRHSAWRIFFDQLNNVMIWLLTGASILSYVLADWIQGTAIVVVIVINTAIGFFTELKAVRSMEALYSLGQVTTRVQRGGTARTIPASELVPGDIVLLEAGDVVTADSRIASASRMLVNESALTGESVPVDKTTEPVAADVPLAERNSMLYKGTAVVRGTGVAVVVATGLATELGKITALVEETESGETPLEQRLEHLGRRLIWITIALIVAISAAGIAIGRDLILMVETAVALAVAAVPEGLPVVATIALARGMWRMADQNALITRLSAVETLGATGVICTDKTGTLTENRMTVTRLLLPSGEFEVRSDQTGPAFATDDENVEPAQTPLLLQALEVGVLCNNAELPAPGIASDTAAGDPMEVALLIAGARANLRRDALLRTKPEVREEAFDPETKMMATFHCAGERAGPLQIAIKGAPEAVIDACRRLRTASAIVPFDDAQKATWQAHNTRMAAQGLRMLGLATGQADSSDADPYADPVFTGLVGLVDPPRQDVRDALMRCHSAGIEVIMVTGDQAPTALYVARDIGLIEDGDADVLPGEALKPPEQLTPEQRGKLLGTRVFARVSPRQKLDLIALQQDAGAVVAMTGDGVNDAPALKKADIGIAMGRRGTQVAREAADMVLQDDAFRSIVVGIEQGRIIFANIRKFALYLVSCNLSEVLVVGLATLASAPLPILPLQILFLNLVTDVFPALALGVGPGGPRVMEHRPRPVREAILTRAHWIAISIHSALITLATLAAFWIALNWLEMTPPAAVTVSFLTLSLAQLWHVFNMREADSGFLRNDITLNGYIWGALLLCIALLLAAVYVPPLAFVLAVQRPSTAGWSLVLGASLIPWGAGQMYLALRGRVPR